MGREFTDEQSLRIYGKTNEEREAEWAAAKEKRDKVSAVRGRRWSDLPAMLICPLQYRYEDGKWIRGCKGVAVRRGGSYACADCGFRWDAKGVAQMDRVAIRKVLKLGKLRKDRTGLEADEPMPTIANRLDAPGIRVHAEPGSLASRLLGLGAEEDDGPGGPLGHLGAGASVEAYRG